MENWEEVLSTSSTQRSSHRQQQRPSDSKPYKLERLEDKQKEYYTLIAQYRDVWYPHVADDDTTMKPTHWKQVIKFQHPPFSIVSWKQIVDSEHLFRQICLLNHELFVSCASLTDYYDDHRQYNDNHNHDNDNQQHAGTSIEFSGNGYHNDSSYGNDDLVDDDDYHTELEAFMSSIIPFWEVMRKERTAIINHYRPNNNNNDMEENETEEYASSTTTTEENKPFSNEKNESNIGWVGWLTKVFGVRRGGRLSYVDSSNSQQIDIPVVAHEDPECSPNGYHYTKLVGRLYFHYSPLRQFILQQRKDQPDHDHVIEEDEEQQEGEDLDENSDWDSPRSTNLPAEFEQQRQSIIEQRATKIRNLVDQCPSPGNLSDKTIRLLVRSYVDMGTLDSSHQAERIYNQYPRHQKNLLWYVLMSYLKVVEDQVYKPHINQSVGFTGRPLARRRIPRSDASSISYVNKTASLATKRICELVSSKHAKNPSEFQSCSQIAFQALACLAPHYDSLNGYFDRVHSLGILKFGPKVWNSLIQTKDDDQERQNNDILKLGLHSKDYKTLHSLILIYGQDEQYLDRALRLFDVSFDNFATSDLQEIFKRSTFHTLLATLHVRQQQRFAVEDSQTQSAKYDKNEYTNPELDIAFRLLDKMVMGKIWYPVSVTFVSLFGLAGRSVLASERVWARLGLLGSDFHAVDEAFSTSSPYVLNPVVAARFTLNAYANLAKNDQQLLGGADPAERSWQIVRSLQASSTPLFMPREETSNIYDPDVAPDSRVYDCILRVCCFVNSPKALEVALRVLEVAQQEGFLTKTGICTKVLKSICNSRDMAQRAKLINHVCQLVMEEDPQLLKKNFGKYAGKQISYIRNMYPQLYDEHLSELDMKYKFSDEFYDKNEEDGSAVL